MTDLVLVNPNRRIAAPFAAIEPPLWLGLIAGHHLERGKSVAIVDAEAEGLTIEQTVQRVNALQPRETIIVVMGNNPSVSSTPKMLIAEELLKFLSAKLTGLHPTAMKYPNTILKPFEGFPFVPWDLLPMDKYRAHNWHCLDDLDKRSPYGVFYTSLNCPFNCSFCNVHTLYGDQRMRQRPLSDIYVDLSYLAHQGIRNIKIWDELFCLDSVRINQICEFLIYSGFKFNIWAYSHVNSPIEKLLPKMKKAGINWLAYGFESTSYPVRLMSGKKFSQLAAGRAIAMTRDAGINTIANFMFGLPGESMDGMKASYEMACQENFEYVNFSVALPYPGSEWWDSLPEPKPTDWARFGQFHPNMYGDPKVVKFRDEAFHAYFSRPEYLSMIKAKFGEKAEAHIKEMEAWRIK